jgi:TonB family protein
LKRAKQILFVAFLLAGGLCAAERGGRKLLQHDDAEYPPIAAKLAIHGVVKLRIWIAPEGSVRRVEYIGGHPLLAESAVKSVKTWKFEPAAKESTEIAEVKF